MEERKAKAQKKAGGVPKKGKNKKQAAKGKGGKGGKSKAPAGPKPIFDVENPAVITCLDIRVGNIISCKVSIYVPLYLVARMVLLSVSVLPLASRTRKNFSSKRLTLVTQKSEPSAAD